MKPKRLDVELEYITKYGQDLFIRLNNTKELPMNWNEGHKWRGGIDVEGDNIMYQYIVRYRGQLQRIEECDVRNVYMPSSARFIEQWGYPLASHCFYEPVQREAVIIDFDNEPIVTEKANESDDEELILKSELLQSVKIIPELGASLFVPSNEKKLYNYPEYKANDDNSEEELMIVEENTYDLFVAQQQVETQKKKKTVSLMKGNEKKSSNVTSQKKTHVNENKEIKFIFVMIFPYRKNIIHHSMSMTI